MIWILAYFSAAIVFFALDMLWLGVIAKDFYASQLGDLKAEKVNVFVAAAFYAAYIGGVIFFAVRPSLAGGGWMEAFTLGLLFGFFCYATYDLTNLATTRGWPATLSLVDMAWGSLLTAMAATAGHLGAKALG